MRNSIVTLNVYFKLLPAITRMLQGDIVVWLSKVGETRAATWFSDNWTGEQGNYTIATAGYAGNNCPLVLSLTGDT
jgi:hypothetical protein